MAASLVLLCLGAALVLDFGLVRVDREIDQSSADSATLAGLHALNIGDGSPHPYIGVCNAVRFLKANDSRFSWVNESAGWKNGVGTATASGCTNITLRNRTCSTTDKTSWAVWHGTGTSGTLSLDVTIESGYSLATAASTSWPDNSLPASSPNTAKLGCDQLAVSISQSREPGLGSLATDSDLVTRIRSVGRVKPVPGHSAPSMLLLKRTGCPVLQTGNTGGGSGTFIHVLGALSTDKKLSQPGTIHADTDGTGCTGGSNQSIYLGLQDSGIVGYAAPLASNPSAPDPARPGSITSVAAANGASLSVIRDSLNNVYGSSALTSGGTRNEVTGRQLVTRGGIDQRYFTGVKGAISAANSVFVAGASGAPTGWTTLNNCNPTPAQVISYNSSTNLYISCSANLGFGNTIGATGLTIKAGNVFFSGVVNPNGPLSMPNAAHVYVANQGNKTDGLNIGNGATFGVNNGTANLSAGVCSTGSSASKSELFVRSGDIRESNGGTLQLCRTAVFMMGGQSNGCVPSTAGTAPTITPCGGGLGTGQFTQQGGNIDWTAPDTMDVTLDSTGNPLPAAVAAWADANGPEDLALWSESSSNSSTTYNMAGGGTFHVRGVYMIPNAQPFIISGGSGMNLTNAQYIVTSIQLNGGTQITMSVDPNSAVVLPDIGLEGLVR